MWFGAYSGCSQSLETCWKIIWFGEMWTISGPLSEKLNFKFVINSKMDFLNIFQVASSEKSF